MRAGLKGIVVKEYCFFYINTAIIQGREIVKIGISNNPEKRIKEFNNGIRHRSKGGHCELVCFIRSFTIRLINRTHAVNIERRFKNNNKQYLLNRFGNEVFDISLDIAVGSVK